MDSREEPLASQWTRSGAFWTRRIKTSSQHATVLPVPRDPRLHESRLLFGEHQCSRIYSSRAFEVPLRLHDAHIRVRVASEQQVPELVGGNSAQQQSHVGIKVAVCPLDSFKI